MDCSDRSAKCLEQPLNKDGNWLDVLDPVGGCLAYQFDRQVYGIEIKFA